MTRRILFYTHAFSGGGAEAVFARLARAFADGGDDVVFAADFAGDRPYADVANLRHLILGPNHAMSTLRLTRLLRRQRFDASFSALGAQNLKHAVAAALAGRLKRCVLGYHGFANVEPKRLSRLSYRLTPLTTRAAARTICVSDALQSHVIATWGGCRARVLKIYNPLPPPVLSAAPVRDPDLVLSLGRLVSFKRFPDLVEAFSQVRRSTAHLVILGEGPERPAIERAIARFGLAHRVRLAGHVDDPSPWYAKAACVAIASESESFGLTAAEAFQHGTPVVTTDCGGVPEVLGGCGRVVPIGDVVALADAISMTLATPGDPAPRLARAEVFSLHTIHAAYAALADSLG